MYELSDVEIDSVSGGHEDSAWDEFWYDVGHAVGEAVRSVGEALSDLPPPSDPMDHKLQIGPEYQL